MKSLTKFFSTTLWMSAVLLSVGLFLVSCGSTGSDDPPVTDASVSLSVAVGATGSEVSIANSIKGNYSLYTSSEDDCDLANYTNCANVELNSISAGTTANLSNLTKATTGDYYFYLVNAEGVSVKTTLSLQRFSARNSHQVAEVNGTMYLIGGYDGTTSLNDVWSSTDGANWTQVVANASFSARYLHQVAVLDNTMYLMGGFDGDSWLDDVWSSTDGMNWTQVNTIPPIFTARNDHDVAVLDGTMYLTGGYDGTSWLNDVWSSMDGETWKQEIANAPFSARSDHQVAVVGNTMYLIGGYDNINDSWLDDVWSSANGANWAQVTTVPPIFSGRSGHQVAVLAGTMYLIGGYDVANKNDVWSSTDGETWIEKTANAAFSARYAHQVVEVNGTMYLIGGTDGANDFNDVWSSRDGGATWTEPPHALSFDY